MHRRLQLLKHQHMLAGHTHRIEPMLSWRPAISAALIVEAKSACSADTASSRFRAWCGPGSFLLTATWTPSRGLLGITGQSEAKTKFTPACSCKAQQNSGWKIEIKKIEIGKGIEGVMELPAYQSGAQCLKCFKNASVP